MFTAQQHNINSLTYSDYDRHKLCMYILYKVYRLTDRHKHDYRGVVVYPANPNGESHIWRYIDEPAQLHSPTEQTVRTKHHTAISISTETEGKCPHLSGTTTPHCCSV